MFACPHELNLKSAKQNVTINQNFSYATFPYRPSIYHYGKMIKSIESFVLKLKNQSGISTMQYQLQLCSFTLKTSIYKMISNTVTKVFRLSNHDQNNKKKHTKMKINKAKITFS